MTTEMKMCTTLMVAFAVTLGWVLVEFNYQLQKHSKLNLRGFLRENKIAVIFI